MRTAFRRFFGFVSRLSPRIGAVPAEILFLSPPAQRRTRAEEAVLAAGKSFRVRTPGGRLAAWSWGSGPRVLLVHGWGGHAGRLSRFVEPLVAAGFSVVAFDAPAHGDSSGRRSSLPDFVDAILAVAAATGPVTAVIAHSMGARRPAPSRWDGGSAPIARSSSRRPRTRSATSASLRASSASPTTHATR